MQGENGTTFKRTMSLYATIFVQHNFLGLLRKVGQFLVSHELTLRPLRQHFEADREFAFIQLSQKACSCVGNRRKRPPPKHDIFSRSLLYKMLLNVYFDVRRHPTHFKNGHATAKELNTGCTSP